MAAQAPSVSEAGCVFAALTVAWPVLCQAYGTLGGEEWPCEKRSLSSSLNAAAVVLSSGSKNYPVLQQHHFVLKQTSVLPLLSLQWVTLIFDERLMGWKCWKARWLSHNCISEQQLVRASVKQSNISWMQFDTKPSHLWNTVYAVYSKHRGLLA